jgi:hypothetical protein
VIALVGPVIGVMLTLVVSGRRDARSRFGDEKRTVYADFLSACTRLRDTRVWAPGSVPGEDTGPVLQQVRGSAMHAVLVAHRDVGRALAAVISAAEQLTTTIEDIRQSSKPGHQGAMDERQRPRYENALSTLSAALNEFTREARRDMNVRTPMADPFPPAGSDR